MPHVNQAGIDLIKQFEGCDLNAYADPGTGGEPYTIGYGHTGLVNGEPVALGMTITQQTAEELLETDLEAFETDVNKYVARNLTPNQFAACVSLCYNIGPSAFAGSTVLRDINKGDFDGAKAAFGMWINGPDGPMEGLIRRRAAEAELFGTP